MTEWGILGLSVLKRDPPKLEGPWPPHGGRAVGDMGYGLLGTEGEKQLRPRVLRSAPHGEEVALSSLWLCHVWGSGWDI